MTPKQLCAMSHAMATVAVFSPKGGVGKTSLSVNLAWVSATLSSRRTLLWDLDGQGAASFILAPGLKRGDAARALIERKVEPERLIVPTGIERLDLLPADDTLRSLDATLAGIGAAKRLRRIADDLGRRYDRIVIDCPPGLGTVADHVIRAASAIVMPVIPSPLAMRAAAALRHHLDTRGKGRPPLLPVFSIADRRRALHREALAAAPDQPVIPMASVVEQMTARHQPLGAFAPCTPAAEAVAALWVLVERRLAAE